jgi:hypothetical protein
MSADESLAGTPCPIDRTKWPKGPWDVEPDRVDWKTAAGFPAIALRQAEGYWCGYVGVPPGHPAHGMDYMDIPVDVHGGVTYAEPCGGRVCHVPAPGEPADVFWIGFDFHHGGDMAPGYLSLYPFLETVGREKTKYRDLAYVRANCESVGLQLAAMRP